MGTNGLSKAVTALRTLNYIATRHPLARQAPLRTVMRYIRWQGASIMMRIPMVVPFVDSTMIVAERGSGSGGVSVVYTGLWDPAEMSFMLHLLQRDDWFADIGANIGLYSILAAGVRQARCVTAEPVPQTVEKLQRNIDLNRLHSLVDIRSVAVGSVTGESQFSTEHNDENHVIRDTAKGITVPTMRLDDLLQDRAPTVLKIDVEGFEHEVLLGGSKTLADPTLKGVIIELIGLGERYGYPDAITDALIRSYGFEPMDYDFRKRCLTKRTSIGKIDHGNILYVRDQETIEQRIKHAPCFYVPVMDQTF